MPETKRVSFYMTQKELEFIDRLKQVKFYDKSYSEMYRYLINKAIESEKEN